MGVVAITVSNWRDKAQCSKSPEYAAMAFGDDLDEDELYTSLDAMIFARDVCLECPVMTQCREWVDKNPQEFGTFGGLTSIDRNPTDNSSTDETL